MNSSTNRKEREEEDSEIESMDYMFQFDQTEDLFLSFSLPGCQLHTAQQPDEQLPSPTQHGTHLCTEKLPRSFGWRRKSPIALNENDGNPSEIKKRKIMHRDIERQRRQEMATLHSSLRTLLPLEYIKGKRSISDHMYEAVNYIKHLQNKIEELSNKRDRLQRLCNSSDAGIMPNSPGATKDVVTVRAFCEGIEVVLNTAHEEQGFPLSRLLQVLIREGLSIIRCISTKVKDRLFHTIESEVNGGRDIDLSELQQKLTRLINQSWIRYIYGTRLDLLTCATTSRLEITVCASKCLMKAC